MDNTLTISSHWIALGAAIILTSISQVLLRSGAKGKAGLNSPSLLNTRILFGYMIFLVVALLMIYAMQEVSLRAASAMNSITFILVPIMAHKFVKDPMNPRIMLGSLTILIGVVVFFI